MGDETAVLQAYARRCSSPYSLSKALCHLSRRPASSFPSIPSRSRGPLVTSSNMSILALPLGVHFSFSIHHFPLLCTTSSYAQSLCSFCLSYQMRARDVKSVTKARHKAVICGWYPYTKNISSLPSSPALALSFFLPFSRLTLLSIFRSLLLFFGIWEIFVLTAVISWVFSPPTSCVKNP